MAPPDRPTNVLLWALLTQIPYPGWLVAPVSFVLALSGLLLVRRPTSAQPDLAVRR